MGWEIEEFRMEAIRSCHVIPTNNPASGKDMTYAYTSEVQDIMMKEKKKEGSRAC